MAMLCVVTRASNTHADTINSKNVARRIDVVAEFVDRNDQAGKSAVYFLKNLTDDEVAIRKLADLAVSDHGWRDAPNVYVSFFEEDDCVNIGYWRSYRFEYGDFDSVAAARSEVIQKSKAEICDGSYPDAELFSAKADIAKRLGH